MKRTTAVSLIFLLLFIKASQAQLPPLQQKAIVLKRLIELKHYSPRSVDDSFSVSVFKSMLNAADPRRLLFTMAEYQQLLAFSKNLDDELQGKSWGFIDQFSELYKKSLVRADSIINKVLQKPFDFEANETITSYKRNAVFTFSKDVASLNLLWSKYLKYTILDDVYDMVNADSIKKMTFKQGLITLEPAIREKVKRNQLKNIQRSLDYPAGFAAMISELYLDAIATCFDPHTNYFSPKGKEEFQSQLSTEGYFLGIVFNENEKGQVIIEKLDPGGAAWKSGEIHKGDELISLQWEGKEVQDMTGASLDEVIDVIDQSIHDKLSLRLRKTDGTITNVSLRKEKTSNEENIVKSFILKGEKKIGYILLPGFYTEWENETGTSCASDVAKEILKLKRENIEGLILDVRYNGGGSIGEALDMIGIFIEEGPLVAEKEKVGKLITLKDPNRGTIYDGPMTLMVNGQSASASEMLAASLQDYNRAVIVGSNTFGKATMQQMFPLDTLAKKITTLADDKDMVKITVGKLFRLNGETAQLKGVAPDVQMTDAFEGLNIGERFQQYPLAADTVQRNNYYKPLPSLPIGELKKRSAARIANNADFKMINTVVSEQQKAMQLESRIIPLKADQFEKWLQQQKLNLEAMKGEGKSTATYKVENHAQDKQLLANNEFAKEQNEIWLENITNDIYIQEVVFVLTDLINLQKSATKN